MAGARDDIAALIARTFDAGRRWGFKDPRTVLTLPLWRDVIGPMDYVICVRREEEVTESLRRGGVVMDDFAQWWLDLNVLALEHTVDERRLIVCYDDWFADPRDVVERLALFLTGVREVPEAAWQRIQAFFEPSLRHIDLRPSGVSDAAVTEVDALYELMRLAADGGDDPAARARHLSVARWLASSHRTRRELEARASESDGLRASADELRARCNELAGNVADRDRELADLERELTERERELTGAHQALDRARAELDVFATSRSWRLTAPMRNAAQRVRILRRPG